MTKARRRRPRPGSYLPPIEAEALLAYDPTLNRMHRALIRAGFTLKKTLRPYLNKRRVVSLRFVWRKRAANDANVTFTATEQVPLDDILKAR